MALRLTTPPSGLAVSVAAVKLHLHIDADLTAEDAAVQALITAATEDAEHLMQAAVLSQQWTLTLDAFPAQVDLRRPPVSGVVSVKYIDPTGTQRTLDPAAYQLIPGEKLSRLAPAYGAAWPSIRPQPDAVECVFTAGWANEAAVPELVKAWIKLRVGALRGEPWPDYADHLLDRYSSITL